MLYQLLKCKIHRATVTRCDLHYEGSIGIDTTLMAAAGLVPFEAVHVWNINSGARLETYALPAAPGSNEICLNGAAARLVQRGDLVIIAAFGWMTDEERARHVPRVVFVDDANRLTVVQEDRRHEDVLGPAGVA